MSLIQWPMKSVGVETKEVSFQIYLESFENLVSP